MAIKIQKQPVAGKKSASLFSSMPSPVTRSVPKLVPPPPMRRPGIQISRPPVAQMQPPVAQMQPPVAQMQQPVQQPVQQQVQAPTGFNPSQGASLFNPVAGGPMLPAPVQQQMQQPMQQIDPSLAQIQGGPYNPPQMQQPAMDTMMPPQMQQPMQQPIQQPPSPFANEPGRDSNGMLIPGYGTPPPGTFLSQPVDKPNDIYGGLTPGQALGGGFTMQQPVAGPIDPSFAKIGFGRFQDEFGNFIT
jgi:hypothetical protein